MDRRSKPPTPEKEDRVQIVAKDEFPFLDMKMSWSPEGELQFGVFRKKVQQLKYVGKESTHAPGTLRAIPSGVFNRLAKLTSRKPSIQEAAVESIYPAHAKALRKSGLAPSVFPTMGELWEKQDEKLEKNKERDVSVKKTEMSIFVLLTHVTFLRQSTG